MSKSRKPLIAAVAVAGGVLVIAGGVAAWCYRDSGLVDDAMSAESMEVRLQAIDELGHRSSDAAVEALLELSCSENTEIAVRAIHAMGRSDQAGRYRDRVLEAVESQNPAVCEAAVTALGNFGSSDDLDRLGQLLREAESPEVRARAARMLGRMDRWEGFDDLVSALNDPSLPVRAEACAGIERKLGRGFGYHPEMGSSQRMQIMSELRQSAPKLREAYEDYHRRKEGQ
ncbi:MAG: HEAT repeat domain-containing protein [Phycisphaerae bacterium]